MDKKTHVRYQYMQVTYQILSLILLLLLLPVFLVLYILVKCTSSGPFLFKQKRLGKHKKEFTIYKIRTMVENADRLKEKYAYLNEYKAPIFKMKHDPRYTLIGKILAKFGIDELPQLLNILNRDISLVGPRPLPVQEALAIPRTYQKRFDVLPGMIPPWFSEGKDVLTTDKWLDLDLEYIKQKSFNTDLQIIIKGILSILRI